MNYICWNGKFLKEDALILPAGNRSYRYGDGLFETMKVYKGRILLKDYHFDRLFQSLNLLEFQLPGFLKADKLEELVLALCEKNNCSKLARVRLSWSRGQGGLYDDSGTALYLIECWPLDNSVNTLNENGLVLGVYPAARKSCDVFSNLKSANFLLYSLAARYAKQHKLNDCLVLNSYDRIADSTIANIFWLKDEVIYTNPLTEGCVNGVMRRYLLQEMKNDLQAAGFQVQESPVTTEQLLQADGLFLSNAIRGLRWVRQFQDNNYLPGLIPEISRLVNRYIDHE